MSTSPRPEEARRDWGHDPVGCTILHIDMDAFYASCEIVRHPELAGRPVIIGTGARAVVSAASYEARAYGVNSAMPVSAARRRCPDGVFLPVDMAYYREMSARVFAIFEQVTPVIEKVSVDEGYLDVSGALGAWPGGSEQIGAWIRATVHSTLGVTCSVGIGSNKLIAKLASTNAKPDGMLIVPKARNADFMRVMPLRAVPGIGPATEKALVAWGCGSVAQLAELSEEDLWHATGSRVEARRLWLVARGEDDRKIVVHAPEKSIGAERTFEQDQVTLGPVADLLRSCCDEAASRLRSRQLVGHTVTLKIRYDDLQYASRSHTVREPLNTVAQIYPAAHSLLCGVLRVPEDSGRQTRLFRPIRLVGVSVSSLESSHGAVFQPSFDDLVGEQAQDATTPSVVSAKAGEAEKAIDSVRRRFGKNAVGFGLDSSHLVGRTPERGRASGVGRDSARGSVES